MRSKRSRWLLLLGIVLSWLLFVGLAIAVQQSPQGIFQEQNLLWAIHHTANPVLDQVATIVTAMGIYGGTLPILVILGIILALAKQWRSLSFIAVTALGSVVLNYLTKTLIARPRPYLWDSSYHGPTNPAFPSGHALSSLMLGMILILLSWGSCWQPLTVIVSLIFALTIAWTRLYLGVHYPSDILGGWCLVIGWTLTIYQLFSKPQI
ncbi:MAG: phosphatase PAP2 family protein [Snowella sp.]|nr:phosphatase PAP2 family protein [Snowella sp.]